jgi:hypothetical protein
MNNIDTIIKYLSGDLDSKEKLKFEDLLKKDSEFTKEYHSILSIWRTIENQLKLDELENNSNREEHIAELVAEHDIAQFRNKKESLKEQAFRREIRKLLEEKKSPILNLKWKSGRRLRIGLLITSIAAAILLTLLPIKNATILASIYYKPIDDSYLENYAASTRSESLNGFYFFKEGDFDHAKKSFRDRDEAMDYYEEIFYAIACFETGEKSKAVDTLTGLLQSKEPEVSYKASWYLAIFYIKMDEPDEALKILREMQDKKGEYQKKVIKLIRKLD